MAILPVTPEDVEYFTTVINPIRKFSSSSSGVTGSIDLFPRGSKIEKEPRPLTSFQSSVFDDNDLESLRLKTKQAVKNAVDSGGQSAYGPVESYLNAVHEQPRSAKKLQKIQIKRFTPSFKFTSNTIRKLNVKDMLMVHYRPSYPSANWAYTNYHSLNFFSGPTVPSSSVLLYPNVGDSSLPEHPGYVSGTYALSGAFSFDFYVNPRYQSDGGITLGFKAGTLFHLSSSYALSLVTGSRKDVNGLPYGFRLQLQLSHSADVSPSLASPGTYPNDLVFLSEDNSLEWNKWHRVVVRWGTNIVNDGSGSFNVDGVDKGYFHIPSATIMPKIFSTKDDPSMLCVGNYYEGTNQTFNSQGHFFSEVPAIREGLQQLINNGGTQDQPNQYAFNHPLNAEVHDLAIRRYYMTDVDIYNTYNVGTGSISKRGTAFFVPPFFIEKTPIRRFTPFASGSDYGGILQTPFFEIDGSTDDPFNVALSFGVGGHYINLENFVKDFANDVFPRLHHLSGTAIEYTTEARSANEFLYDDPYVRKRNLTILPCDDGGFRPVYNLIADKISNKSVDDLNRQNKSLINLDNLLNQESVLFSSTFDDEKDSTFVDQQIGFSPEFPGKTPGPAVMNVANQISATISYNTEDYGPGVQKGVPLTIFQRTKDSSSNQVVFFDISNLYYGNKILPGSFELKDLSMSGSGGRVAMTLKDDGNGNIYRANSQSGDDCTWNSVGNIFYSEGVVVIKSPHLFFFGKDSYEMSFKGEYNLHSTKYEILAPSGMLNSSSNPTFFRPPRLPAIFNKQNPILPPAEALGKELRASGDPLDNELFVYISGINFHDENLNVVAKATLAQPVLKREGEKFLVKVVFDF